jgi:hypothetical protein
MTDRKWLVWIVAMGVAAEIAKHVGAWVFVPVLVGLIWWSIEQENHVHS